MVPLERLLKLVGIHARSWNVTADAMHRQQTQREQEPLAQIGNAEDVCQFVKHLLQDLKLAASFGDLFLRRLGEFMSLDGERGREFTVAKNFYRVLGMNDASLA